MNVILEHFKRYTNPGTGVFPLSGREAVDSISYDETRVMPGVEWRETGYTHDV